MNDVNALYPTLKNGRPPFPKDGDRIYVPSREYPHVIGGLATVAKAISGYRLSDRKVFVVEHPDVSYAWIDLIERQVSLWEKYGATKARMPTAEERIDLAVRKEEERETLEKKARDAEETARERKKPRSYPILNGALVEQPIERAAHKRARNWAAIATYAPTTAGGIERHWFERAAGKIAGYVIPATLCDHDVIEFGADHVRFTGSRVQKRWYGVVVSHTNDALVLEPCDNAAAAFILSRDRKIAAQARARAAG
jgi:hypothetical protein